MRSTRRSPWRFGRPVSLTFLLLLTLLTTTLVARAADDDAEEGDEYDVKARVVRISLITGDVSLKRNGNTDWERARLNFALVEGDTISTDAQARVEIQFDARNFVRLGSNSILKIVTLRDEGVALSVAEGTVSVRLAKFDREHEYFEVDAPQSTLSAEKTGLYRIDVSREGRVRLSARDGGRARIYSETSGFALRDGRTAELSYDGANVGDWEFVAADAGDSWDSWINERERYLAERLRYDTQYYDNYVWGAEDLDAYGNWAYTSDYGWIWRPHTTVVNNYDDWAPYRYGSWCWVAPHGWTWVGYEPWGWAPYHYGRWVYYNNYWAWCPRSLYYRHRSWWRPALVAFSLSFGNDVCWYPLHYRQRDPHSRYYHHNDRLRPLRADELARLQRVNPAYYRAVTAVAARDFGADGARPRRADDALARRALNAEPLRTDLPIRPSSAPSDRSAAGDRTERVTVARPARVAPPRDLSDRPTGAATRMPGAELDNELRRTRVLNGREGIPGRAESPVPTAGASGPVETRPTGAVTRPARPIRETEPRVEPGNADDGGSGDQRRDANRVPAAAERPARTEQRIPRDNVPAQPQVTEPERRLRVPDRPERSEPPANVERPERHERPQAPARTESPRSEPAPHYEPPVRNDPPPRSDPPPRNDPPARSEPPPRNDPPPRHDPPARSEPPPRNDPPSRSESSPSRSESSPSRSESPSRSDSGGDRTPSKSRDPR